MGTRDRVIPNWVNRTDPSGQLRPDANNAMARSSKPVNIQAQTIAEDAVIPIVYGGPERIAGMPYTTGLASNGVDLLVSYILCEGEIEAITAVELNNEPLPAGVVVSGYYGTQTQGIDPDVAAAIGPDYDERHLGTAYIVARFPPGSVASFPNLTAEIYGRKITNRGQKGITFAAAPANNYAVLAESAQNNLNGATQIEITFVAALAQWAASAAPQVLFSKWLQSAVKQTLSLQLSPAGDLRLYMSTTGGAFDSQFDSTPKIPLAPGQFGGVKAVVNLQNAGSRTCQFYYSTDGVAWIELGPPAVLAGASVMVDLGGTKWQVSARSNGAENYPAVGIVYSATAKWGGVEHVRFNPEAAADGAVAWNAPTGEVWTVVGGPTVQPRAAHASTNPAAIIDDYMRTYGRRLVNAASVVTSAAFCDAPIANAKRATLTITLGEARGADDWVEALRAYIPGWVIYKDGEWHIVPDAPSAPVLAYDADADNRTDGAEPMVLVKRGTRDVPNVVEVTYTETGTKPWTDKKVLAQLSGIGTGKRRKTNLSFPGIRTFAQAYRWAVERLNHFTLENIEGDVAVMDDGIRVVPGDIVTINDSAHGWAAKPVRVLHVSESENGRWALRFRIYNAGAYSTDAPAAPPLPDSGTLPNPVNVQPVTGLAASESLRYENASINTSDALARGLIWQSRIVATWTASPDAFFDFYEISIQSASMPQPSVTTSKLAQFCSAPLVQGTTYTVSVRAINSLGFASAFATVNVAVNGKVNPPSDVASIDFAAEIGGECILRWKPVPDVDIVRYEWRGLATAAASAAWDSMPVLDRPDTNYTRIKGLAPGPTLFAIKAIDSVGRYSVNPKFVNLTITSDASNFLQTFAFTPNASGNIQQQDWPLVEGVARPLPRWIVIGNQPWNTAMPNPVASGSPIPVVAGRGRAAGWSFGSNTWDWGLVLEASVELDLTYFSTLNAGNPGALPAIYLVTSLDGSAWAYPNYWGSPVGGPNLGRVTAKVTARFIRLEFYSQTAADVVMQEGAIAAQVSSTTRSESGSATSSASTYTRINLVQKYTKWVSISITPRGTTFATGSFDNVTVGLAVAPNYFDVYLFNASGVQVSQAFSWHFEGV